MLVKCGLVMTKHWTTFKPQALTRQDTAELYMVLVDIEKSIAVINSTGTMRDWSC